MRFRLKFFFRSLVYPLTTFSYLDRLAKLPVMRQALSTQGLLPVKIHRPYLCTRFTVKQRAEALLAHYATVQQLPLTLQQLFLSPTDKRLACLQGKNNDEFEILCASGRYEREGEITLVLRYSAVNIASLSFSFVRQPVGRVILIGGLQGPHKSVNANIIREATKASFGLFPKRILMETLLYLAVRCQVQQIQAVGDITHVFHSLRYRYSKKDVFHASYSEFWQSIGGEARPDGLYLLPLAIPRKLPEEIASKKRAEYRRRYELLARLEQQLAAVLADTAIISRVH